MAVTATDHADRASSSSDGIEAPRDSVTSHDRNGQSRQGPDGKPDLAMESTFVDSRTGQEVDVEKAYPGVAPEDLPPHLEKRRNRVHFDHLGSRFGTATHSGVKGKHQRAVTVLGRIGWVAKGIVYALIGGLCCRGAVSEDLNIDASPQGAFVLIGKGVTGIYILIIMAVALATYIIWRFWEGITAQGSHPCYTPFTNFFRFRLSPLVSGFVYTAYLVYILTLLPKAFDYHNDAVANTNGNDFTKSWGRTGIGRFGLVLVGLAFLIATIVMLQGALTKKFHRELRLKELRPWAKWLVLVTGHLGAGGRAGLFLLVSVLMWRALEGQERGTNSDQNTVGRALSQLRSSHWGRALLFFIGFGLIIYGLFACLNCYPAKIFPTPLPSQAEMDAMMAARAEKDKAKAEKKARASVITDNRVPTAAAQGNGAASGAAQPAITPVANAV